MAEQKKKKVEDSSVTDYLANLFLPTPDQGQGQKVAQGINDTEVDRHGNVIPKRRK